VPLSKLEHVRALQRLKKLMEADDPYMDVEGGPEALLLYTEL
jgi:hypothetical protein